MNNKIKVNIIAGSGSYQGPGSWIFSDMVEILTMGIDISKFELTITPNIDESKLYDVYHYFHSTLAVQNNGKMAHRSLITIHALSDLEPNWSFEYKEPFLKNAKKISSVSTEIISTIVNRGIDKNKIYYTPAGVDIEKFTPTFFEERQKIAKQYNISTKDYIRFGIISRRYDDGRKGEEFLTSIINNFSDVDKYRFMFIGTNWGSYLNSIVQQYNIDSNLFEVFEKNLDCSYEDYPNLYGLMDAVLVTSKVDSGPVCILESLAKGIPVISTPTGLAKELLVKRIDNEYLGQIVSYGDIYTFIDAINNKIINNINKIRSIEYRNKIRDVILNSSKYEPHNQYSMLDTYQNYTWESFCKRFEKIYEDIYNECNGKIFLEDFLNKETQNKYISFYSTQATNNLTNVYLENYQQIKNYAKTGPGIINFKNILKDQPTVIVGAGPSLDKNIDVLKQYQNNINIFSCDAALPILYQNNIKPDVVVVADPSDRQVQNFIGINGKEFLTVLPTVVHPMTFNEARKSDCIITWYNIADHNIELCKWIPKEIGYKGMVRPAVLTSGMVYQIAVYMGCSPITFIGHDLCWEDLNQGYATGISEQKNIYQRNNKMMNNPVFLFYDINGKIVTSDLSFINFVQWINNFLQEYTLKVYNSTNSGILYGENIIQLDFNDWCQKFQTTFNQSTFNLLYQVYMSVKMGNDIIITP